MTQWRPSPRAQHGGADEIPLPSTAGRLWLCGKRFIGPDPEAALAEVGATTAVCLNEASELEERYPQYVAWLRQHAPVRAVWFPVPDLHAPELEPARLLIRELHRRLDDGEGLLVHCGAGIGRAGTIAAGLLVTMGIDLDEALDDVRRHRPMAGPESDAQHDLVAALAAGL